MSKKIISAVVASFLFYSSQSQLSSSNLNTVRIDDNPSFSSSSRNPVITTSSSLLNNNVRFEDNPNRLADDSSLKVPISNSFSTVSSNGNIIRFEDNPNRLFDDSRLKVNSFSTGVRFQDNPNRLVDDLSLKVPVSLSGSNIRFEDNPNRRVDDNSRISSSLSSNTVRFEDNPNRLFDDNSSSRHLGINVKPNWSYLVGIKGDCAAKIINNQRKDLKCFIIKQGGVATMDYRTDRVRIYVDANNNVIIPPVIG